jgi:hypothetical protein
VLLATLAVPPDARAIEFVLACVIDSGHPLVIAGFIDVPAGRGLTLPAPVLDAVLQPAIDYVSEVGVSLRVFKIRTPRPLRAILQVACEIDAGLLAFGPDLSRLRRWRYTRAARFLTDRASCLLWLADMGNVNALTAVDGR